MKINPRGKLSVEVNPAAAGNIESSSLSFREGTNTLVIPQDVTVEFEISRQLLSSSQEAVFSIRNLSPKTRNLLQRDPYVTNVYQAIQFRAGYDLALPIVFNGFVRHATSERVGDDFVTTISAYDGGLAMANGFTSLTLSAGISVRDTLIQLARSLPRLAGSAIIGNFPGVNKRGKVLFGNTWQIILQESGGLATIDNGQVKALQYNEAVNAPIPVITSDSGLLGVPKRTPTSLAFDMLFEPGLTIGQLVQLQSRSQPIYNGLYKVAGFTHRGVISPVEGTGCRSSVSLFFGIDEFTRVAGSLVQ